ncbi:Chaperonin Cpn60/TCP-1 [Carpediemonas membranifera]|uniref:CCT-eta n=1 Tax=Carpediemonas membranifera TaxID=201153 RepID=A0A8J6E244_9EUKA|nr:Chaperonin Cpn60/TCP-1 [Carpediemonas membranifera]|eukprot:KAG9397164.1 Chaperonin Cpn60/TCP-1 [Carpediemonas membranifera]
MNTNLQPAIVLLKDGSEQAQGSSHILTNIKASKAVCDTIKTTLGPRGMDKLLQGQNGTIVSNDGATIMRELDVVHPAAKTLVDISRAQDIEIGDGTTSVVVLAGAMLEAARPYIEEGIHANTIISTFRKGGELAAKVVEAFATTQATDTEVLRRLASTSMNSKLISASSKFLSQLVVDAVSVDAELGIKTELGGSLEETQLIHGIAFKRTFTYAGAEQQEKHFVNPKIALLNVELELKAEKDNAEIRISDPAKFQEIVATEHDIIRSKLETIKATGANVVLSKLAIGDLATQWFADEGMFSAGRVDGDDMKRLVAATGGKVLSTVNGMNATHLGVCESFDEEYLGSTPYNFFRGCPAATLIIRGGAEQFIAETERSLHDAIMVVRRSIKTTNQRVVAGGGAVEMEISRQLQEAAGEIVGKEQFLLGAYGKAFETIPRQLIENAGFDATTVLNMLRTVHAEPDVAFDSTQPESDFNRNRFAGVNIKEEGIINTHAAFVWEPIQIKLNAIQAATEAACQILSIDMTVSNPKHEQAQAQARQDHHAMQQKMANAGITPQAAAAGMGGGMGGGMRHFQGRRGR